MQKSAFISECGQYRYELTRTWLTGGKNIAFIMLNPSTADADNDDPTMNRVISFCQKWGFGSVTVGNLFALRATNPKDLYFHPDPIGEQNDWQLQRIIRKSEAVICAWGSHGHYKDRAHDVFHKIDKPKYYLDLTIFNEPKHPLYIKGDTLPKSFSLFQKPWGVK